MTILMSPEQLDASCRERRSRWIARERGRSWGRGFATGIILCLLLVAAARVGEAWGAAPAGSTLGARPHVVAPSACELRSAHLGVSLRCR